MRISVASLHLKPSSTARCRVPGKQGKRFRNAVDLTKEHRYNKVKMCIKTTWMDSLQVQGKALYNMAILHEALGEYDHVEKTDVPMVFCNLENQSVI